MSNINFTAQLYILGKHKYVLNTDVDFSEIKPNSFAICLITSEDHQLFKEHPNLLNLQGKFVLIRRFFSSIGIHNHEDNIWTFIDSSETLDFIDYTQPVIASTSDEIALKLDGVDDITTNVAIETFSLDANTKTVTIIQ